MIPPVSLPLTGSSSAGRSQAISPSVLIIGAGIAGCALAYFLARHGIPVTVLEGGEIGQQGASAVGAALINPYRGRSARPGPFDLDGLSCFWRLCNSLEQDGHDPGARRSGVVRVASSDRQARAWRDLPGLRALAPVPSPYHAPHGAFLAEYGGWVDPARLLAALVAAASERGALFSERWPVSRIERRGADWFAFGGSGEASSRALVLCLGAGAVTGVSLPQLELMAGDQLTLRSSKHLPYPVAGPVYFASNGSEVMIGGNHRQAGTHDPRAPELLRASAARIVPALSEAPLVRVWTGVRAKRPDNVPLLEELQPDLWFLGGFGGRGFLTAPLLAERLAYDISTRY